MITKHYRYYSKYVSESGSERFELFWAPNDDAAAEQAILRSKSDGMRLKGTNRCVCIVPRVKVVRDSKTSLLKDFRVDRNGFVIPKRKRNLQ